MGAPEYQAGWYAAPNLPPGMLRWWDGARWTEHVHPVPEVATQTAAPGSAGAGAVHGATIANGASGDAGLSAMGSSGLSPGAGGALSPGASAGLTPGVSGDASLGLAAGGIGSEVSGMLGQVQSAQASAAPSTYAIGSPVVTAGTDLASGPQVRVSAYQRNRTTFTALGLVAAYILLALTAKVYLLGIVPTVTAVRAFRRGEPLAPIALAVVFLLFILPWVILVLLAGSL